MIRHALYVELKARSGKEDELAAWLANAGPATRAWFGIRFDDRTFAIFDAFDDEAGRDAHLNGKVAAALMTRAGELLDEAPQIRRAAVLADKLPA